MVALFKALVPGIVLTYVVCLVLGRNGSKGGYLFIQYMQLSGNDTFTDPTYGLYWSWFLFFAATGLFFAIIKMME